MEEDGWADVEGVAPPPSGHPLILLSIFLLLGHHLQVETHSGINYALYIYTCERNNMLSPKVAAPAMAWHSLGQRRQSQLEGHSTSAPHSPALGRS